MRLMRAICMQSVSQENGFRLIVISFKLFVCCCINGCVTNTAKAKFEFKFYHRIKDARFQKDTYY